VPSPDQPVLPIGSPHTPRAGIRWKRVLIISAVGALLVVGALSAAAWLGKANLAGTFGVPQDFPIYPTATLVGVRETVGTGGTRVDASWEADGSLDTVTAFYSQRLN